MAKEIQKQFVDVEGLEDLKPGTGVDVGGGMKYEYGSQLETEGVPLIDPGGGPVNVIRVFNFSMHPLVKSLTDKQAIFTAHAKQIENILWGDGLRPLDEVPPRVIIDNKNRSYQIFVSCQAAKGVIFSQKDSNPELLHKQLNGKLDPKTS